MSIKCYVIDDEQHAIDVISNYIDKTPSLELIGTELDPLNAIGRIGDGELLPDITFVDVDMPEMSGIDVAALIGNRTLIIFSTAFPDYAVDAFEKNAIDYIVKPINYERFLKAVDKARQRISERKINAKTQELPYFFIKVEVKGKLLKIEEDEIFYIEAKQNYIEIYLENTSHLTYLSLGEIAEKLPPEKFIRTHKSFIANLHKVKTVEGGSITFINGKQILLGTAYKLSFMDGINQKVIRSKRG